MATPQVPADTAGEVSAADWRNCGAHFGGANRSAQNPASVVLPMERLMWLKHLGEGGHSPQARVLIVAEELRIAARRRQTTGRWCHRRGGGAPDWLPPNLLADDGGVIISLAPQPRNPVARRQMPP
jgi:hypothetical protein